MQQDIIQLLLLLLLLLLLSGAHTLCQQAHSHTAGWQQQSRYMPLLLPQQGLASQRPTKWT
jgi:hypothetical protein